MTRLLRPHQVGRESLILLALLAVGLLLAWRAYLFPRAAILAIDAPSAILPLQGFHEVEQFADRPGRYRWTSGDASIRLPNPGGAAVLRLVMAGGPARAVPVELRSGNTTTTFSARPEPRTYAIALPDAAGERLTIAITSPVVRQRNRDLGVVVGDLKIAGGGAPPLQLLLALAVATAGLYALLRRSGLRRAYAAGAVALAQALALLWQSAGLWSYALLGTLLLLAGGASLAALALERIWPPVACPEQPWPQLTRQDWVAVAALIGLALLVRVPWLTAPDPVGDLELSARRMGFLYADGLAGAFRFDGDYMPLRLYWLLLFSRLAPLLGGGFADPIPAPTLVLIKLPGLLADLATAALIYVWSRRWLAGRASAILAALYTLAPPVWMIVAWWGQVDAILLLPLLLAVALLDRAGGRWSWACWAIALLIKTQAIIFAPPLYVATLRRHGSRGLAGGGALAALLLAAGCAPLALAGQGPGLAQAYFGAVGRFPQITNRAYNLWYLVTGGASGSDLAPLIGPLSYRAVGMALVGAVVLLACLALLRRSDAPARAEAAGVVALAFFLLPTQIHERYLFFALAFLVLRAASDPRLLIPYLALVTTATLNILGALSGFSEAATRVVAASPLPIAIAAANLIVLIFLIGHLLLVSRQSEEQPSSSSQLTAPPRARG